MTVRVPAEKLDALLAAGQRAGRVGHHPQRLPRSLAIDLDRHLALRHRGDEHLRLRVLHDVGDFLGREVGVDAGVVQAGALAGARVSTGSLAGAIASSFTSRGDAPADARYKALAGLKEPGRNWHLGATPGGLYAFASADGINWRKPDLGLFEINGDRHNNVILDHSFAPVSHNFCPMIDDRPGVPPEERFKAVGGGMTTSAESKATGAVRGLYRLVSADGILMAMSTGMTREAERCRFALKRAAEGKTVAELEAALRAELKRVQDEGVSAEELARVKTQSIAAQIYKRDSLMAQAMEIGGIEATGLSWRDVDPLLEKLKSVTAEEVQAVARKYFSDDTLSIAVLDPQPIENSKPRKPSGAVRH